MEHTSTTFKGFRTPKQDCVVLVNEGGDAWANLPLYLNEVNHSPTGFEWGYFGSGPSQLAYAILRYMCGKMYTETEAQELAEEYYMRFKERVIATIDRKEWILKEEDVTAFIIDTMAGWEVGVWRDLTNEPNRVRITITE